MRKLKSLFTVLAVVTFLSVNAQDITVDEIIDGYFENTGGKEAWNNLNGVKWTGKFKQGAMEFPVTMVQLSDGRQYMQFTFQGMTLKQGVFDGETMWSTNFQSMKAEKSDAESTANAKLDANDFPDSFLNYKEKGYTAELIGTETFEGAETYKVKLVKEPRMVDGKEVEDVTYYYFDTEAFVPLGTESEIKNGPMAGQMGISTMSEYQEVDGLYFPFSMGQGVKGQPTQPIVIESIELNPTVEESEFAFPEE